MDRSLTRYDEQVRKDDVRHTASGESSVRQPPNKVGNASKCAAQIAHTANPELRASASDIERPIDKSGTRLGTVHDFKVSGSQA